MDRIQGYGNNTGISNEYWDMDKIQGYGHRIQGYGQNKLDRIEGMWMNTGIWIHPNSIFTYTLLHLFSIPPTYPFTSIQSPVPLTTPIFHPPYFSLHFNPFSPTPHYSYFPSSLHLNPILTPLTTPISHPPCLSLHFNPILIPLTTPNSILPYPSLLLFPILPTSHFT